MRALPAGTGRMVTTALVKTASVCGPPGGTKRIPRSMPAVAGPRASSRFGSSASRVAIGTKPSPESTCVISVPRESPPAAAGLSSNTSVSQNRPPSMCERNPNPTNCPSCRMASSAWRVVT